MEGQLEGENPVVVVLQLHQIDFQPGRAPGDRERIVQNPIILQRDVWALGSIDGTPRESSTPRDYKRFVTR
jgi:hypothetical protein